METKYHAEEGIITTPGKFQGEPLYVPYFHEFLGGGEILSTMEDGAGVYSERLTLTPEDVEKFPELKGADYITITENEQGFVSHELLTEPELERRARQAAEVYCVCVYCVCVYLVDRAYGGPEEGGWYYDTGEPVIEKGFPLPRFTENLEEAQKWQVEMQGQLDDEANAGRPSIGSMLSQGIYQAQISVGLPKPYPEQKPRYE